MRKILAVLGFAVYAVPLLPQEENSSSPALFISHVTVIDATGAPPKPGMTVVIEEGRIAEIGKEGNLRHGKGGGIDIDGSGKYLIPGLWDMHVHIAGVSANPKPRRISRSARAARHRGEGQSRGLGPARREPA